MYASQTAATSDSTSERPPLATRAPSWPSRPKSFGRRLSSNATRLLRPGLLLRAFRGVKDHHNLHKYSPLLKKTCVRQIVLDKRFPPKSSSSFRTPSGAAPREVRRAT